MTVPPAPPAKRGTIAKENDAGAGGDVGGGGGGVGVTTGVAEGLGRSAVTMGAMVEGTAAAGRAWAAAE